MRGRPSGASRRDDWPFYGVVLVLTALAVAPFWLTRILPMQEYPQLLLFARAFHDHRIPGSPFQGTYTTGFPVAPLVLPILLLDGLGRILGLETAGKLLWSLYAVALPAASIHLLRVLGRDRWCVLLVFPLLLLSYWVTGGFFAFATGAPWLVYGLACGVRWLERPSWQRGALVGFVASALVFWHALMFAQLLLDLGLLWLLWRADDARAKLRAILPVLPSLGLASAWVLVAVRHRPAWSPRATAWPPFLDNVPHFFDHIAPIIPGATGLALLLGLLLLLVGSLGAPRPSRAQTPGGASFRVTSPFVWLGLAAVAGYLVMPGQALGVEGINNRQPWIAALLFVFGWRLPARPAARSLLLGVVAAAGAASLVHLATLFRAFDRETAGASRLIDRLGKEETLLAPMGDGGSKTFPGRPLIALELYASVRRGGLPNKSFAGYTINFIRYVDDKNPMPGFGNTWLDPALTRFDHVLLRAPSEAILKRPTLRFEARDGEWVLMAVCGGRVAPTCP